MLKIFNLTAEECWIAPFRLNRTWVTSSIIVCAAVVVFYLLASGMLRINETVPDLSPYLWVHGIAYFVIGSTIVEGLVLAIALRIGEQALGQIGGIVYSTIFLAIIYLNGIHLRGIELFLIVIAITLNALVQVLIIVESKSVWNSVIFHGIWNFFLASRILFIGEWRGENTIYIIPFTDAPILLTGGAAGCEASLVAIAAVGVMIFIAIFKIRGKKKASLQVVEAQVDQE